MSATALLHQAVEPREAVEEAPHDYATLHARATHDVPGQEHHAHYHGVPAGAPTPRTRFAGALRHVAHGHVTHEPVTPGHADTATLAAEEDVLVFRRVMEEPAPVVSFDEVVVEASRARRRARSPHRPFRLTTAQWIIVTTLFGQLTGVLWWQSQALALRNRDQRLRDEIARTGQQIAQTKHAISQLDSEGNLEQLAGQMKWSRAPLNNFDNVTNRHRLTPQQIAALNAPANTDAAGEAATASEPQDKAPDSSSATPTATPEATPDAASDSETMSPAGEGH